MPAALAAAVEARFGTAWPAAGSQPREVLDALSAEGRHWDAAVLAARLEADDGNSPDAAAHLAASAARAGLIDTARAALGRAVGAERSRYADAAIAVAARQFADGQAATALATLQRLPLRMPADTRNRAAQLEGRVLLALSRPRDAARVLQNAQFDPLLLIGDPLDDRLDAGIVQYNLALALIRSGEVARGRSLLDRLGLGRDPEPAMQALRDRVNLVLAANFLDAGEGATARAVFERVSLEGPYSGRALLGIGWASLAAQGRGQRNGLEGDRNGTPETPRFVLRAMQRRRLIDCTTFNRRALAPTELCLESRRFDQARVPSEPEGLALEALALWSELAAREPRDPTVREAWSALGHAAARAGLRNEALGYYEAAAGRLEAALADNAAASARLATDGIAAALEAALGASGFAPGTAPPADRLARYEAALGLDAATGRSQTAALLEGCGVARWLLAGQPEDETASTLAAAHAAALADDAAARLAAERGQLTTWLASVRAALATLGDPSFVLPPPG